MRREVLGHTGRPLGKVLHLDLSARPRAQGVGTEEGGGIFPPMSTKSPHASGVSAYVETVWNESILPTLKTYIAIPNKSPDFDEAWEANGHMERAVALIEAWCRGRRIAGLELEVVRLPGRTPLVLIEIPAHRCDAPGTVLLYGHYDKQPEMQGWRSDLGPWVPKLEGDKLYGRGGADDGYAVFASLTAIEALQAQGLPHGRCVVVIEGCEESGSADLPAYIDHLSGRLGEPELVVCLDSGAGNYEQLWLTTSLRGNLVTTLRVETVTEGLHSGAASGIVPSSFRVLRLLLDRLEDARTGAIKLPEFNVSIPAGRIEQACAVAQVLGEQIVSAFPFHESAQPVSADPVELLLNRTWRPTLSVTGADGLPPVRNAGNVLRPLTAVKLSLRLPPTADPGRAARSLTEVLTHDAPYGAKVTVGEIDASGGWEAPPLAPWLDQAVTQASEDCFGRPAVQMGEGGSIPFMGMLGASFPRAQFLIAGVLGPGSNAHGPNEFLHVPMAKKLTACVAHVLQAQAARHAV